MTHLIINCDTAQRVFDVQTSANPNSVRQHGSTSMWVEILLYRNSRHLLEILIHSSLYITATFVDI
jgi:hypothetical protein